MKICLRKLVIIMLILVLGIAGILAGCSKNSDKNANNSIADTANTPDNDSDKNEAALSDAKSESDSAAPLTSVTLSEVAHSIFYAPMYVAIENGYFEEEGIDLTLTNANGADNVMTALISGDADIGFMGPEATIYVYSDGMEDTVVNFAQLTQRAGNFLVGRPTGDAQAAESGQASSDKQSNNSEQPADDEQTAESSDETDADFSWSDLIGTTVLGGRAGDVHISM